MKTIISILSFILFVGIYSVSAQCCSNTTKKEEISECSCNGAKSITEIKAYYFHATRRCATCQAVESVTKEAIQEYFGSKVSFKSVNREEEKNRSIAKRYKIGGQTLLIIKGDKVVNLTNYAFMYARTNPGKLKAKIKSTIDSIL